MPFFKVLISSSHLWPFLSAHLLGLLRPAANALISSHYCKYIPRVEGCNFLWLESHTPAICQKKLSSFKADQLRKDHGLTLWGYPVGYPVMMNKCATEQLNTSCLSMWGVQALSWEYRESQDESWWSSWIGASLPLLISLHLCIT